MTGDGRLDPLGPGNGASFMEHLARQAAHVLLPPALGQGLAPKIPHGTTVVALLTGDGVIMAGDRRATMGTTIASHRMHKVYPADESSVLGIAGTAGLAIDMVRLFQVELEHYEKIEGTTLSLEGRANRLGAMVRGNLAMASEGLAVVPLYAGFDHVLRRGRIFSYDLTGGRYEEHEHYAVGSGSPYAKGALKRVFRAALDSEQAVRVAVESLYDAAEEDAATSGPDPVRNLWPLVYEVSAAGVQHWPDEQIARICRDVLRQRTRNTAAEASG